MSRQPDPTTRSPRGPADDQWRSTILDLAVGAIAHRLATGRVALPDPDLLPPRLREPGACFVTLERDGHLLGCIGSIEPRRPLGVDAAANALGAAFRDPRFGPLHASDFTAMDVEISVLSPPTPLDVGDIRALAAALRPGVDGVVIDAPGHRATFLPTVWAKLPDTRSFLEHLWRKAELRPFRWPDDLRVETYTTELLIERGPRPMPVPLHRPGPGA